MTQRTINYLTLFCTVAVGFAVCLVVPPIEGLGDKVRIAFFHIPVAWVSVLAFTLSAYWALRYLLSRKIAFDYKNAIAVKLGLIFCLLATFSGAAFAKMTWGAYWNWDPRQTTIFILLLIYGANLALRSAIEDEEYRAKIAAVYSLLSVFTLPFLVFIIPRYYYSLHPSPIINNSGSLFIDKILLYMLIICVLICTAIFWRFFTYLMNLSIKRR